MEGSVKGLQYHRTFFSLKFTCLAIMMLFLNVDRVASDAANMLVNGDFQAQQISFGLYPSQDMLARGIRNLLPHWTCAYGGVQLLDSGVYAQAATDNASFVVHMNSREGPGHLASTPMYTPRKGAMYTISMSIADNPDGGPVQKSVMLLMFHEDGSEVKPAARPFITNASSEAHASIVWQRVRWKLFGRGRPVLVYLVSLVKGSYGILLANVQVNLDSLVPNGSFEALDPALRVDGAVAAAPSSGIKGWAVETGAVQLSLSEAGNKTAGFHGLQPSTDGSGTVLGLNSRTAASVISTTFGVDASKSRRFALLFDTAADPSYTETVLAQLIVNLTAQPSGDALASETYNLSSVHYTMNSVGWETKRLEFKTPGKAADGVTRVKLMFTSEVIGSYGPLLDNIQVYEILETGNFSDVGTASTYPMPTYGTRQGVVMTIIMFTLGWTGEIQGLLDWL